MRNSACCVEATTRANFHQGNYIIIMCVSCALFITIKLIFIFITHTKDTQEDPSIPPEHQPLFEGMGDVALFKDGEMRSAGYVHRSPRIEESGESRVILIIDIPQEGWHFD